MGFALPNASVLDPIAQTLLQAHPDFSRLKEAIDSLFRLLISTTGIRPDSPRWTQPVCLPTGKSIGPYWAAMCIQDILRTKRFVRGLQLAIESARKTFPDQPIHILYAGTGPFATLALPITTVYRPDQVQFTFLEIHPEAFACLETTIAAFRMQEFVHRSVLSDATRYTPDRPVHILLSETMQRALENEPQVAITQHLLPFLHPDGFLVPESISLFAGLLNPSESMKRLQDFDHSPEFYIRKLATILELNKQNATAFIEGFPVLEVTLPPEALNGFTQVSLFTRLSVFGPETLGPWESGITLPKLLMQFEDPLPAAARLSFQYLNGPKPGVQFRRIE